MAKQQTSETRTKIDDINDTLSKAEIKIQQNKKVVMWIAVAVAAILVIVLGYIYFIRKPQINKANDQIGLVDNKAVTYEFSNQNNMLDSAGRAQSLAEIIQGYEAASKAGHDAGERAKLMSAVYLYKAGDYQKALTYLKDFDSSSDVVEALAKGLEGDCLVNTDKYDEAIKCYQEAANEVKDNQVLVPYFIEKEAVVQDHLKKYSVEADLYNRILKEFPLYAQANYDNYTFLIARANQLAGK